MHVVDHCVTARVASDRANPEDAVLVAQVGAMAWFAVADGAGGLSGGRRAAAHVIEAIAALAARTDADLGAPDTWQAVLSALDDGIARDRDAGETTAVVGALVGDRLVGASVGDSEAWIVGLDDVRVVTESQRRRPRLGTGAAIPVGFAHDLGDAVLLVATDGLFRHVRPEAIASQLRSMPGSEAASALVALARGATGRLADDVGLAILTGRSRRVTSPDPIP